MADEFILDGFKLPVTVELHKKIARAQLLSFKAFSNWKTTLQTNLELQYTNADHAFHDDPYVLYNIEIQSVDFFTPTKIGFVKLKAEIRNSKKNKLPGIAFLRGGSVAMLMILRPEDSRDERWVVMTEQPRVPAGSLSFIEIPAGMLDDAGNFAGKAAEEIQEETGFKLPESELIDLTELALKELKPEGETLQNAMYPSPGGSDEYIPIFLWEKVSLLLHYGVKLN
jgi:ADP-sugar diphosphatase